MKIIDLSQKIYDKMPYHPYDEEPKIIQDKMIDRDKYNNTQISLGMHVGTHIDAPNHLIENGKRIGEYDLSKFIGKGCVIDASKEKEIVLKDEYKKEIDGSDIVLIYTGYGEYFDKDKYYGDDAPVFSEDFARYLSEKQINMVGMDLPSPDKYPFEVHKILLGNDVLIIENLTNLHNLIGMKDFKIYAMPLKIDAEASITRVIAIIE